MEKVFETFEIEGICKEATEAPSALNINLSFNSSARSAVIDLSPVSEHIRAHSEQFQANI